MHERQMHEKSCFITLTYDEKHLPEGGTLVVKHGQDFLKKLRERFKGKKITYMICGEYGEQNQRPHYHLCVFGIDFDDKYHYKTKNGIKHYRSPLLEEIWTYGNSDLGEVTFESAAYVARYVTKKITGPNAAKHYGTKQPEYMHTSKRPALGKTWYEKYKTDVFPSGNVVVKRNGGAIAMAPPKYYKTLLERENQLEHAKQRAKNQNASRKMEAKGEQTHERLKTKKELKELKAKQLKRNYEMDNEQ